MKYALALALSLTLFLACHKDESAAPAPAPVAVEPTPTAAPVPATTAGETKTISPSQEVAGLLGKMQYEAAHRPNTGKTAEQVFAALDKAGIPLTRTRQYAGFAMQAAYCAGGVGPNDVPISVCEYTTVAEAEAGKKFMDHQLAANGVRALHGTTLLNVARTDGDLAKRAVTALDSL